jgi:hypothetical protein
VHLPVRNGDKHGSPRRLRIHLKLKELKIVGCRAAVIDYYEKLLERQRSSWVIAAEGKCTGPIETSPKARTDERW